MAEIQHGIAWSDSLNTGNARVDSQHKRIFRLLSDVMRQCAEGDYSATLEETLNFLVDYTVKHFTDEEALQLACKYPGYERHRKLHEDFKTTVGGLVKAFGESGSSKELADGVNSVMAIWLITHIQKEDKKIAEHIRAGKKN